MILWLNLYKANWCNELNILWWIKLPNVSGLINKIPVWIFLSGGGIGSSIPYHPIDPGRWRLWHRYVSFQVMLVMSIQLADGGKREGHTVRGFIQRRPDQKCIVFTLFPPAIIRLLVNTRLKMCEEEVTGFPNS